MSANSSFSISFYFVFFFLCFFWFCRSLKFNYIYSVWIGGQRPTEYFYSFDLSHFANRHYTFTQFFLFRSCFFFFRVVVISHRWERNRREKKKQSATIGKSISVLVEKTKINLTALIEQVSFVSNPINYLCLFEYLKCPAMDNLNSFNDI